MARQGQAHPVPTTVRRAKKPTFYLGSQSDDNAGSGGAIRARSNSSTSRAGSCLSNELSDSASEAGGSVSVASDSPPASSLPNAARRRRRASSNLNPHHPPPSASALLAGRRPRAQQLDAVPQGLPHDASPSPPETRRPSRDRVAPVHRRVSPFLRPPVSRGHTPSRTRTHPHTVLTTQTFCLQASSSSTKVDEQDDGEWVSDENADSSADEQQQRRPSTGAEEHPRVVVQADEHQSDEDEDDEEDDEEEDDDSSGWGSEYSTESDLSGPRTSSGANRQRDGSSLFVKRPPSDASLVRNASTGPGLLSQMFHPESSSTSLSNVHDSPSSSRVSEGLKAPPAQAAVQQQGENAPKPHLTRPSAPRAATTSAGKHALYRAAPEGTELESSSEEEDDDASGAQQNGKAEANGSSSRRTSADAADESEYTSKAEAALARLQQQQTSRQQERRQQQQYPTHHVAGAVGRPLPPLHQQSAPDVPTMAQPQTPRTTRRAMLATELSESLRRNLLWERQTRNKVFGGPPRPPAAATAVNSQQQVQQAQLAAQQQQQQRQQQQQQQQQQAAAGAAAGGGAAAKAASSGGSSRRSEERPESAGSSNGQAAHTTHGFSGQTLGAEPGSGSSGGTAPPPGPGRSKSLLSPLSALNLSSTGSNTSLSSQQQQQGNSNSNNSSTITRNGQSLTHLPRAGASSSQLSQSSDKQRSNHHHHHHHSHHRHHSREKKPAKSSLMQPHRGSTEHLSALALSSLPRRHTTGAGLNKLGGPNAGNVPSGKGPTGAAGAGGAGAGGLTAQHAQRGSSANLAKYGYYHGGVGADDSDSSSASLSSSSSCDSDSDTGGGGSGGNGHEDASRQYYEPGRPNDNGSGVSTASNAHGSGLRRNQSGIQKESVVSHLHTHGW